MIDLLLAAALNWGPMPTTPDPEGACCLYSGCDNGAIFFCISESTELACDIVAGTFGWCHWEFHPFTDCDDDPCEDWDDIVGSCCVHEHGGSGPVCLDKTRSDCEALETETIKVVWSYETNCIDDPCEELGRCRLCDGSCEDLTTEDECTALGGWDWQPNRLCTPQSTSQVGACCYGASGNVCAEVVKPCCDAIGGWWRGPEVSCLGGACDS